MSMITYIPDGDVTQDDADILVNTVNTVGVMGKGVAKAFATEFPWIVEPYKEACRMGEITEGSVKLFELYHPKRVRWWAAFATKGHWRYPSRLKCIESGLGQLWAKAIGVGARSIAIPPPGCGLGGLDWAIVEPLLLQKLEGLDLRIYAKSTLYGRGLQAA